MGKRFPSALSNLRIIWQQIKGQIVLPGVFGASRAAGHGTHLQCLVLHMWAGGC